MKRSYDSELNPRQSVKRWYIIGGVVGGLVGAILLRLCLSEPAYDHHPVVVASGPIYHPVRVKAWEKIEPKLLQADQTGTMVVERQLETIRDFFRQRRQGAAAFAEETLSLAGKWELVKSKLSFDDGEGHRRYLRERFEEHVFRGEDLRLAVEAAVTGTLTELKGLENAVITEVRVDLADSELFSGNMAPGLQSEEAFRHAYEQMAQKVMTVVARDLGVTVGREVVAWVASDIAAQVVTRVGVAIAARLGVSGGILGAGAASGWATFGVGLGVGLLVDMSLDWVLRQAGYDAARDVAAKVEEALDRLQEALIDGDTAANGTAAPGGQLGLRGELLRLCECQARVRREALRKLVLEGGVP
jgi:hypothetical protein